MECLKNYAYMIPPEPCQLIFTQLGQLMRGDAYTAAIGAFQPGHDHHHGGFSCTRRPYDTDCIPFFDFQVDPSENMHRTGAAVESDMDAGELDNRLGLLFYIYGWQNGLPVRGKCL
jgi:hypothetical protein